jgi:hypothetical protein
LALGFALTGCSHAKKKDVALSEMLGKKVALISIDGEETARKVTEVALINQLVQHGSFDLVSKQDVEKARIAPDQDPMDWIGIARRSGADYALKAKVIQFDATEHQGYSSEKVEDSQMAQDMGEDHRMTDQIYKVKSLAAKVQIELAFAKTDPKDPDLRTGIAESEETATSGTRTEAPHLPPSLRFLEQLEGKAFAKFFEQYR